MYVKVRCVRLDTMRVCSGTILVTSAMYVEFLFVVNVGHQAHFLFYVRQIIFYYYFLFKRTKRWNYYHNIKMLYLDHYLHDIKLFRHDYLDTILLYRVIFTSF